MKETNNKLHLVFVVKHRKKVIDIKIEKYLKDIFQSVLRSKQSELLEFNTQKDHVHLLINLNLKTSVSEIAKLLKGRSSFLVRQKFVVLKRYLWGGSFWTPSYFVSSVGFVSQDTISKYIKNQKKEG